MPIASADVDATLRSRWAVVDDYLTERLVASDSSLDDVPAVSTRAGLPHIEVSPLQWALRLSRPGSVIVIDNVIRGGRVTDTDTHDGRVTGTRAVLDLIKVEPRLDATALPTVGDKGWDGFVLALVTS